MIPLNLEVEHLLRKRNEIMLELGATKKALGIVGRDAQREMEIQKRYLFSLSSLYYNQEQVIAFLSEIFKNALIIQKNHLDTHPHLSTHHFDINFWRKQIDEIDTKIIHQLILGSKIKES